MKSNWQNPAYKRIERYEREKRLETSIIEAEEKIRKGKEELAKLKTSMGVLHEVVEEKAAHQKEAMKSSGV